MVMDGLVKKIILIDDESYVYERVVQIIKKYNVEFDYIDNAKQAKEKLIASSYDVVITEAFIYGLTSLEVNKLAHDKNPNVCVIVLSRLSTLDIAHKTLKEGAFAFLIKPSEIDKLESLIDLYFISK